jgi:gamma-glutamylcyclotransferase (GGCT)/AIG2-like uncharacterized protein YtfP
MGTGEDGKVMHNVFVYGTLRPQDTEATHILYDYDMFNYYDKFPYIMEAFGNDDSLIYGNVLRVTDAQLARLDKIEGVDRGLYVREEVEVKDIITKETMTAFVYVGGNIVPSFIPCGDWFERENQS